MDRFAELFNRWRNSKEEYTSNFSEDGIIDEKKWNISSKKKVLVVLKETNNYSKDLRALIRDDWKGAKNYLWKNVGRWVYGIQNTTKAFIPDRSDADVYRNEALLSSAVINLKKTKGRSNSDMNEVRKYAIEDANFIREEFNLINPEVIICGYTFGIVKEILGINSSSLNNEHRIFIFNNRKFINYWHPAAHYPADMSYYTLSALYQKGL